MPSMLAVEYPGSVPFKAWSYAPARGGMYKPVTSQRPEVMPVPVRKPILEAGLLKDMAVMVIANESRTQGFLRSTLLSLGAEVHVATGSTGAVDLMNCFEKRFDIVFADCQLLKRVMAERDAKATTTISSTPVAVLYAEGEAKKSISKAGTYFLAKSSPLQRTALVSMVQQILANHSAQPDSSTSYMEKSLSDTHSEESREAPGHTDIQSPPTPPRCVTPPRLSTFNHSSSKSAFSRYSPHKRAKIASTSADPSCIPPFFAASRYPYAAMPAHHGRHMHPMHPPTYATHHHPPAPTESAESTSGPEDPESIRVANATRRAEALQRFREKRKRLTFEKKVRYASRKRLAENRPRLRGQFVRQTDNSSDTQSTLSTSDEE